MSYSEALELAPPDPLGVRYAQAKGRGRTYLASRWEDGREVFQIVHDHLGERRCRRVVSVPASLAWVPVETVWSECLPGQTNELARESS